MSQPGFFDLDERHNKLNERDPLIHLTRLIWHRGTGRPSEPH